MGIKKILVFHGKVLKIDILVKNHYHLMISIISLIIKNCNFFNLQYGDAYEDELSEYINKTGVKLITHDELDLFNDFDNLAALLKNLDLFITISNSTNFICRCFWY